MLEKVKELLFTPTGAGLFFVGLGVLFIVGTIREWKWILDVSGERRGLRVLLYEWFGEKGLKAGAIISGISFILCGLAFILLM